MGNLIEMWGDVQSKQDEWMNRKCKEMLERIWKKTMPVYHYAFVERVISVLCKLHFSCKQRNKR